MPREESQSPIHRFRQMNLLEKITLAFLAPLVGAGVIATLIYAWEVAGVAL